ncbi:MAG TPA: peptidoglycan-associated lipoprotein Pal [Dongiaceae bacterium]|nr:peptidoglycan-associated lipoprotein Pal [Dongiaceae bacterium]
MRRSRLRTALALCVLLPAVLVWAGCGKKSAKGVETEPTPAAPDTTTPPPPPPPPPPSQTTEDNTAWQDAIQDVFFDYDKYDIRSDARDVLQKDATGLKAHSGGTMVLEGHCDERGTPEYNLALGQRRADAVMAYLKDLGVETGSIQTVSYGEERPFDQGHDESAWAKNRRVHFRFQ